MFILLALNSAGEACATTLLIWVHCGVHLGVRFSNDALPAWFSSLRQSKQLFHLWLWWLESHRWWLLVFGCILRQFDIWELLMQLYEVLNLSHTLASNNLLSLWAIRSWWILWFIAQNVETCLNLRLNALVPWTFNFCTDMRRNVWLMQSRALHGWLIIRKAVGLHANNLLIASMLRGNDRCLSIPLWSK